MIEILVKIKTPIGCAKTTAKRFGTALLGFNSNATLYVNKDNSVLYWLMDCTPKQVVSINKKVALFGAMVQSAMSSKAIKWYIKKHDCDVAQVDDMLTDQTTVDIIKQNEKNAELEYIEKECIRV